MCPTYDYTHNEQCDCVRGQMFEAFESITTNPMTSCPECGLPVRRLIGSGSPPIFKGSGFYQTDYKSNKTEPTPEVKPTEHKPADPAKAKEPKTYKKD